MGAARRACSGRLTARSRRGWYIQHNWLKRFVAVLRLAEGLCFFFWLSGLTRGDLVAARAFRFCRTGPHLPPPFGRHRAVAAIQQPGANVCARPALACVLPPAASPVLLKAFGGAWAAVVHFAVLRFP